MPVIHTHVSVPTTAEQRDALKTAFGQAIPAVPGKSEGWLMCLFESDVPMYFGGTNDAPAAYVEVNVFGSLGPEVCVAEAHARDHGRAARHLADPRRPHLHPLHRHPGLGLERRQFLKSRPANAESPRQVYLRPDIP